MRRHNVSESSGDVCCVVQLATAAQFGKKENSRASLWSTENVYIQDSNVLTNESEIFHLKSLFVYKRRKWLERSKFKREADFIRQWNCGVRFQDHKVRVTAARQVA